jgi:hypothetical protein
MSMNGMEMGRRGLFANAIEARMTADRLVRHWEARKSALPQTAPGIVDVDALIALGRRLQNKP